jgi:hypothetical protein
VTDPTPRLDDLRSALAAYRRGRAAFLNALGCADSNRDPFAEFSERLVAALYDGVLATSRVQKDFDLVTPDGLKVQVRYLANPADRWVNEHRIYFDDDVDRYSLVVFEGLDFKAVLTFSQATLGAVCAALGKRHPDPERQLQLTRRNYWQLLEERDRFADLRVDVTTF